ESLRDQLGVPHMFSDTDRGALYGIGYATAQDPGKEYLAFQPKGGEDLAVELSAGTYGNEWLEPVQGQSAARGEVLAPGGLERFNAPFPGPALLYLAAAKNEPPDHYYPPSDSQGGWRTLVTRNVLPSPAQKAAVSHTTGLDTDKLVDAWKYVES